MTRKILVVDDEPDMELLIRQKFRKQIASGEFRIDFANNGAAALQILSEKVDIELVMSDINMPVMSGLELLERIEAARFPCKCIVISAYNDVQNIRTAMNRGAFDFVTKPIDFNDLEATISKTLAAVDEMKEVGKARSERDSALVEMEKAVVSEKFKQQFLANMSHEIRTPMNSVIGLTNLLMRMDIGETERKYIMMIKAASDQLMSIINDILDISKIEAGKLVFEQIPFSVRQVVSNVRDILIMKASEQKLEFRTHFSENVSEYYLGDPARLAQILINLAGNSIKFTQSGFVEIHVGVQSVSGDQHILEFNVSDSGIGIPADKTATIFDSFTQAESNTSRKFGGTGLGLAICKQLVEMQSGTIGVESVLGKGTKFYFTLPYRISDHAHQEIRNSDQPEQLSGIHILLTEDNEFNKIVAEDTLNEFIQNVTIQHAPNGKVAVEMVNQFDFDIVLMDIQMPVMDGYEATAAIRQLPDRKKHTPVVIMTANATPEEIKKCFESGADGYVSKPFVPEELFFQMTDAIRKHKNRGS
jgi:signal transduction histidine kinase